MPAILRHRHTRGLCVGCVRQGGGILEGAMELIPAASSADRFGPGAIIPAAPFDDSDVMLVAPPVVIRVPSDSIRRWRWLWRSRGGSCRWKHCDARPDGR